MSVIDLHTHSTCSDGSLRPAELVALAVRNGVGVLALTDHDSVAGLAEAQSAASAAGIRLVPGIELSAVWGKYNIHVVGLHIDADHPELVAGLARQAEARGLRARQIGDRLAERGMPGAYAGALALASRPDAISRTHFSQWLYAQGHVGSIQQAFDRWLGPGKPAAVPMPWATLAEVVGWIRAAGGQAVLAHPGRYALSRTRLRELLSAFADAGGEAMEVATATEKPDMIQYLARLSVQLGLKASQGSDYHGQPAPWIALGRFPALPAVCTPIWTTWQERPA